MIMLKRGAGDADRVEHAAAILRPSTLDEIADALVAYAASGGATAYVERRGDGYRWSPAVRGGPYPLLCVLARFLCCEHTELTIGYRMIEGDWCIAGDPDDPDSYQCAVLDAPVDVEQLRARFA